MKPSLEVLEKAEARYLEASGWRPAPKPRGAENNPDVPQWWKDPMAYPDEQQEYRQDLAVGKQRERDI